VWVGRSGQEGPAELVVEKSMGREQKPLNEMGDLMKEDAWRAGPLTTSVVVYV